MTNTFNLIMRRADARREFLDARHDLEMYCRMWTDSALIEDEQARQEVARLLAVLETAQQAVAAADHDWWTLGQSPPIATA